MKIHQRSDFQAGKYAEKVIIHLTFNGKSFVLPDGSAFDLLKEGAKVELKVMSAHLKEESSVLGLRQPEMRELLPARTTVFARVDLRGMTEKDQFQEPASSDLLRFAERAISLKKSHVDIKQGTVKPYEGLVQIELREPLFMRRIGQKAFQLEGCDCLIWGLHEHPVDVYSLNQALTRISEFAEIHRISHTGNAFLRCLVPMDGRGIASSEGSLMPLAQLRDQFSGTEQAYRPWP